MPNLNAFVLAVPKGTRAAYRRMARPFYALRTIASGFTLRAGA